MLTGLSLTGWTAQLLTYFTLFSWIKNYTGVSTEFYAIIKILRISKCVSFDGKQDNIVKKKVTVFLNILKTSYSKHVLMALQGKILEKGRKSLRDVRWCIWMTFLIEIY